MFSKSFSGVAMQGGTVTLSFLIENPSSTETASVIAFIDDLDAVLPGLAAEGLPVADVCGPGSSITGTSFISLTGGSLGPGESCAFDVTVRVPDTATPGDYVNTTTPLRSGGQLVGAPASAPIEIVLAPTSAAIPVTTPLGTLILVTLLIGIGVWRIRGGL